jgi:AcrR family transcriptional regulator
MVAAGGRRRHPVAEAGTEQGGQRAPRRWKRDPARVRANILAVARTEFAANGLSGARIDEIAAKTATSKRMIYYYFADKEGLYRQVLEDAYREVRAGEEALELDHLEPAEALRRLVEFTFDHHARNPEFIRLVMIENIHNAEFLERSPEIRELNRPAIERLERICLRGLAGGVFRRGIEPLELHWHISALSFFNVSNRATFSGIFGNSLARPAGQKTLRAHAVDMVLRFVLAEGPA